MHVPMWSSIAFAAASAALAAQSVPARPPGLDPSGPWTVEATGTMCLIGRKFDAAGSIFTLGFRKVATTDSFQVLIWRPKRSTEVSKGKARLAFDQMTAFEAPYQRGPVTLPGVELTEIAAKRAQIGALNGAKVLHAKAGDLTISFKLRGTAGALKALEDCEQKLQERQR